MENNCLGPCVPKLLRIQKTVKHIVPVLQHIYTIVYLCGANIQYQVLAVIIFYFFCLLMKLTLANQYYLACQRGDLINQLACKPRKFPQAWSTLLDNLSHFIVQSMNRKGQRHLSVSQQVLILYTDLAFTTGSHMHNNFIIYISGN